MSEHFQTVVIGSSLAGLLAAIKLQLAGQRVLLVIDEADLSGEVLHGYWCSDEDQFFSVPSCSEFNQVLKGLGLDEKPADCDSWQLLFPGCRLDLLSDLAANKEELKRFFTDSAAITSGYGQYGELAAKVRQLLFAGEKTLFPQGAWDKFKRGFTKKELGSLPALPLPADFPEQWRDFERFFLAGHSSLSLAALDKNPSELAFLLATFWQKQYAVPPTVMDFSTLLLNHYIGIGGQFKRAMVTALNIKGGKVTSVVLGAQGEYGCDSVILAGLREQARLISKAGAQKKLAAQEQQRSVDEAVYVVHFLLQAEGRPLGMADRCCGPLAVNEPALVMPWVEIGLTNPAKFSTGAKANMEKKVDNVLVCTVKSLVKPSLLATEGQREQFLTIIKDYLKEIIPFLTDFLIDTTPSSAEGRFYGKIGPRMDGKIDPAGLPINTPFANCWRCQELCLPGMGQEGSWQCANIVVSRALQYFRR